MFDRHWLFASLGFVAFLTLLSGIQQSFAHPVYVDSIPRAFQSVSALPAEVSVSYSEPIELAYSSIKVLGPDGSRVDANDPHNVQGDTASIGVTMQPGLPEGEYTVTTKVLSAVDGHVVEETFIFGVGTIGPIIRDPDQQRDILSPEESASRFPGMVGQVMVVGAAFATLWLWKPLSRVPWLTSAIGQTRSAIDRNMMRLIIIGTGIILASGVAMIVVQSVSIEAGIPEAIATKFGNVWVTRMLQSSILMGIAVAVYRRIAKDNVSPGKAEMYAILILGFAMLVTSSLIAHAAATSQIFPILLDFFHNAAASIWIGGLILLGFVAVPRILAIGDERIRSSALAILIPRFSTVVVTLLGISVITGPVLLFSLESDLSLTLVSVYGQLLAIKLGLAGTMVTMGAYSQFVIQKRAVAVMVGGAGVQAGGIRHYGRMLKAEAGVGIGLIFIVSLMANGALPAGQFPAYERDQEDGQSAFAEKPTNDFVRTLYTGEGKITLVISPFAVGQNNFRVSFLNQDGSNATGIESATLGLTQVERGIGPIAIDTKKMSPNTFSADAAFSLTGVWHIEIEGVNSQGSNMLATFDANVKPLVTNLEFKIDQYKTPDQSTPLYPVFDAERQSIWVGDTRLASGRIWQLDIATGNYAVHRLNDTDIITQIVLDPDGNLWYIDPLSFRSGNGTLGVYDPDNSTTRQFKLKESGIMSGLAMDGNGSLWMPIVVANGPDKVLRFEPTSELFSSFNIPTPEARPAGIAADNNGDIWFAEASAGSIARIDLDTGNITEYRPISPLHALDEPAAVFPDPKSSNIYIGEHNGHTVTMFNPLLGTFREFPAVNEAGLPFGMTMDSYGNLWFAEHQIDRIGVLDPRTGEGAEAKIPIPGSLIQWITSDDKGKIWFAAQQGSTLGSITITAKPSTLPPDGGQPNPSSGGIPELPFSFTDLAGPAIAAGIVISALAYSKSAVDLRRSVRSALGQDVR